MNLTNKQRAALIKWLESMPWWEELPYAQIESEDERLRVRECPVCGRQITVLREIASHMTDGEPCPGSGTPV